MAGRKWLVVLLGVVNVFAMAGIIFWYVSRDNTPPVITREDTIVYEEGMSDEELLDGAVAVDETDGDVSDTLVVEKVTVNYNTGTAVVTCGAVDDSGNIAKESFQMQMRAGAVATAGSVSGEVFTLEAGEAVIDADGTADDETATEEVQTEAETTEAESSEEEPIGEAEADDADAEEEEDAEAEEEAQEEAQEAPAPRANTAQNTEPQVDPAEVPVLVLSANEVTTKKGYNPAWVHIIAQLQDNKDDYQYLLHHLAIHGNYTNAEVGSYDVRVSAVDSDGHESAASALRIIVEE